MPPKYNASTPAPALEGAVAWLNASRPLTRQDLLGRITLMFFWSASDLNSGSLMSEICRLKAMFKTRLTLLGIHIPRFDADGSTAYLIDAVERLSITDPVANDANLRIWREYGISACPALVLTDPRARLVAKTTGAGKNQSIEDGITSLIESFQMELDEDPLPTASLTSARFLAGLAYPGKLLADEFSKRLFISDTMHHRIIITNLCGEILGVVGCGSPGVRDGTFSQAQFYAPQGLALSGDSLYVADSCNHLIRRIDLRRKHVESIAGTGSMTRDHSGGGRGKLQGLNSPWSLAILRDILYIAMAGNNQIWSYNPSSQVLSAVAGSAIEDTLDGGLGFAAFSQPCGLATDGERLFVCDSASSSIRALSLGPTGVVSTILGGQSRQFGHRDGDFDHALLQCPRDISVAHGRIYVADSLNNRLKEIDLLKGLITTLAGNGQGDFKDGPGQNACLAEPSGVSYAQGRLFIADTNNQAVRIFDLLSRELTTLTLPLFRHVNARVMPPISMPGHTGAQSKVHDLPAVSVRTDKDFTVRISLRFKPGYNLEPGAASRVSFSYQGQVGRVYELALHTESISFAMPAPRTIPATLLAEVWAYYGLTDGRGVCRTAHLIFRQPLRAPSASEQPIQTLSFEEAL